MFQTIVQTLKTTSVANKLIQLKKEGISLFVKLFESQMKSKT
jgi:hypothetical protein